MEKIKFFLLWLETYKSGITIIFSIIGGIFVYLKYSHSKRLEYTAIERKEWRSNLRKSLKILILAKMENEKISQNKIDFARANIISNLNPVPNKGSLDEEIFRIFKTKYNQKNLSKEILALKVLLKFDWDRAKKENNLLPFFRKIKEKKYIDKISQDTKN